MNLLLSFLLLFLVNICYIIIIVYNKINGHAANLVFYWQNVVKELHFFRRTLERKGRLYLYLIVVYSMIIGIIVSLFIILTTLFHGVN